MGFLFSAFHAKFIRSLSVLLAVILGWFNGIGIQISVRGCHDSLYDTVSYSFYDPTYKIEQKGRIEKNSSYTMYLAKNEREACQVAFRFRANRDKIKVTLSEFKDENGNVLPSQLYKEEYVSTSSSSFYPDPIVPIEACPTFSVLKETNTPFYIEVRSTKDTPAGDYTATVTVQNIDDPDNAHEKKSIEVKAHVWNFELPDTPSSKTAFGLYYSNVFKAHRVDPASEKAQALKETYYEFLVDHKISPYVIPVDFLSDEAEKYMNDPRITSFNIPYSSDDATLQKYYARVNENPEWAKKAYFYPIDEPRDTQSFESYLAITDRLQKLCPGYRMITPYTAGLKIDINGATVTSTDLEIGRSSMLCPMSFSWETKGAKEKLYAARDKLGSELWWYVCCGPLGDYCNVTINQEGLRHRILFWQQKSLGIDGFLYWETAWWQEVNYDPWSDSHTTKWTDPAAYGDGSLLYNGNKVGIDGPVSSLRLEAITNGLEDYDYLTMAEELLGEEYMDKMIGKVTKDLTTYTYSDKDFAKVRIELGNAIEKAVNAQ